MTLRLPSSWLWDFWFARDGADVHVFYLQAPRSLGDPERRHRNARIGHAVSTDLRNWTVLPAPLPPAPVGAPDDLATWTGSVIRQHDGRWRMFYTGVSVKDDGKVQRIVSATSDDLVHWERTDLILTADPRWYERLDPSLPQEHWRDPWVSWDAPSDRWHMLITARVPVGPVDGRAVIGHATSPDLDSWTVGPPLSDPGEFSQMEVPQLIEVAGRSRILFCAGPQDCSARRRSRLGGRVEGGTHYLVGDRPFGRYAAAVGQFLVGDPEPELYAGRILDLDDRLWFFGWRTRNAHGAFLGELSDPIPAYADADRIEVHRSATTAPNDR